MPEERVDAQLGRDGARQLERHRLTRDLDGLAIGEREHLVERRGDAVDGADETASSAGDDLASRTVEIAHSTLRSRAFAIAVILAIASFMTFSPSVPSMSVPSPLIGEAAPMLVPGAISAMFADERDERAGARREAARRRDPDDHGDLRLEQRADDVVRRESSATARRVELDDHGGDAPTLGVGDRVLEVLGHRAVDDARRGQDDHLRPGAACAGREEQPAERHDRQRDPRQPRPPPTGHGVDHLRGEYRTAGEGADFRP